MESDEDLYIKMNSRGKPLTRVRELQGALRAEHQPLGSSRRVRPQDRRAVVGPDVALPRRRQHRRRRVHALHRLHHRDLRTARWTVGVRKARPACSGDLRRREPEVGRAPRLPLQRLRRLAGRRHMSAAPSTASFPLHCPATTGTTRTRSCSSESTSVNLFEQCCHQFGSQRGGNRAFTLQQSLLLYAVLLHLIEKTEDFPRRVRILRNLLAASAEDEVRRQNMPACSRTSRQSSSTVTSTRSASSAATRCRTSGTRPSSSPHTPTSPETVFRLEDHPILRGTLSSFELTADNFQQRADASRPPSPTRRMAEPDRGPPGHRRLPAPPTRDAGMAVRHGLPRERSGVALPAHRGHARRSRGHPRRFSASSSTASRAAAPTCRPI